MDRGQPREELRNDVPLQAGNEQSPRAGDQKTLRLRKAPRLTGLVFVLPPAQAGKHLMINDVPELAHRQPAKPANGLEL
jgi:hypothetical protein